MTPASRYRIASADQGWHMALCYLCCRGDACERGRRIHQAVDSASISLDLEAAVACEERLRRSVAW